MAYSGGWPPKKGAEFLLVFPIFDNDGDLVTAAAGLDSEISKDSGSFVDCTNEASEIATSSGIYQLTLTATEITADVIAIITKTSTTGAKTAVSIIYTTVNQIDTIDTVVDAIAAKTNALPSDPADQSQVEAAIVAQTARVSF